MAGGVGKAPVGVTVFPGLHRDGIENNIHFILAFVCNAIVLQDQEKSNALQTHASENFDLSLYTK